MPKNALVLAEEFGPAMQALTAQEQTFVCLLFCGLPSLTKAAEQAGFRAVNRAALSVQAHRLIHRADIGAAVIEESKRRTTFLMPKAQTALSNLIDNPQHADHFKAIKMVREESGLSAVVRKVMDVNVNFSQMPQEQKIKHIVSYAAKKGLDPKALLGFDPGVVMDAEFTEALDPEADDEALIESLR